MDEQPHNRHPLLDRLTGSLVMGLLIALGALLLDYFMH